MSERFDKPLLLDMLQSAEQALSFIGSMTEAEFSADKKTRAAVIYSIQVIGEAAAHVSDRTVHANPEVEWGKIIRMRHRVVHDYDQIRDDIIWRVVTSYLPPLVEQLKKILASGVE